jgi:ArsR family transcriptional regulator
MYSDYPDVAGHAREIPVPNALDEIDAIQTTLLRALASPHRLRIIHLLGERPREVHELASELDLAQATVSQHLAAMRSVGLVEAARDGRSVRYELTDLQILVACRLMRDVIVRRLSALGSLAAAARLDANDRATGLTTQASAGFSSPAQQVTHR